MRFSVILLSARDGRSANLICAAVSALAAVSMDFNGLAIQNAHAIEVEAPATNLPKDVPASSPEKKGILDQVPGANSPPSPPVAPFSPSVVSPRAQDGPLRSGNEDPAQQSREKDVILRDSVPGGDPSSRAKIFSPADPAALDREIGALRLLVDALETRLAKLELEKGTVRVPFKVVDASGFPLMLVDGNGATFTAFGGGRVDIPLKQGAVPQIYLGNSEGGLSIEGGANGRLMIDTGGGPPAFELKASQGQGVTMSAKTQEGEFELGSGPALTGLLVKKDNQPAAGLGTFNGRGIALRVFSAGRTVAAMGENPASAGTGIVYVGNGSKNAAALSAEGDGSGKVYAFAADGTVGAGLSGSERLVGAYNASGAAIATLQKSDKSEGGTIRARDPSGEAVFSTGYRADIGGGEACVIRNKRGGNIMCLGLGIPGVGLSP